MERPVGLRTLTARHLNKHHRKHNHFIVAYVPPLVECAQRVFSFYEALANLLVYGCGTGILPVFAPWAGRPCHEGVARASCPCLPHGRDAHATRVWHGHPARVCPMGGTPMPQGCGTGILPVFAPWAGRPCHKGVARASCPCLPHVRDAHATRVWHGHPARVCPMGGTPMPQGCGTGILPVFHGRDAHATRVSPCASVP